MKYELTGVVGGVVVAMIQKGMFNEKTPVELREEIAKTIREVGKAFSD